MKKSNETVLRDISVMYAEPFIVFLVLYYTVASWIGTIDLGFRI